MGIANMTGGGGGTKVKGKEEVLRLTNGQAVAGDTITVALDYDETHRKTFTVPGIQSSASSMSGEVASGDDLLLFVYGSGRVKKKAVRINEDLTGTVGTEYSGNNSNGDLLLYIGNSKFCSFYVSGGSVYGYIISINGTTISETQPAVICSADTTYARCCEVSNNRIFLIAGHYAVIVHISGNTLTCNSTQTLAISTSYTFYNIASITETSVIATTTNKAAIAYEVNDDDSISVGTVTALSNLYQYAYFSPYKTGGKSCIISTSYYDSTYYRMLAYPAKVDGTVLTVISSNWISSINNNDLAVVNIHNIYDAFNLYVRLNNTAEVHNTGGGIATTTGVEIKYSTYKFYGIRICKDRGSVSVSFNATTIGCVVSPLLLGTLETLWGTPIGIAKTQSNQDGQVTVYLTNVLGQEE